MWSQWSMWGILEWTYRTLLNVNSSFVTYQPHDSTERKGTIVFFPRAEIILTKRARELFCFTYFEAMQFFVHVLKQELVWSLSISLSPSREDPRRRNKIVKLPEYLLQTLVEVSSSQYGSSFPLRKSSSEKGIWIPFKIRKNHQNEII